jgi:hypothetical protein
MNAYLDHNLQYFSPSKYLIVLWINPQYYCESCDFGHFTKGLFKLHMEAKHATT